MKTSKSVKMTVLTATFFGVFFLAPTLAGATTIYANYSTGNDTTGDGSSGAPYKTFHKAYTIASANDTINLTGTFTWTNADETGDVATNGYTIAKDLTIQGQGATATIIQAGTASTTGDRRVLTISNTASTTITDLTIQNGRISSGAGGGVYNSGTTTIERVHIRENTTTDTSSGVGGGFANYGTATIRNSAIIYNNAPVQGGGLASPYSGTQSTRPTVMYVINTTIAFNTQSRTSGSVGGAGIFAREGTIYVLNSSIMENNHTGSGNYYGIGISTSGGTISIKNSIIANNRFQGNYVTNQSGEYYDASSFTDSGNNIIGKLASATGLANYSWYDFTGSTGTGDNVYRLVLSAAQTGLFDASDSLTSTGVIRISGNGIAVNNGTTTALSTLESPIIDQINQSRTGNPDIGAYEFVASNNSAPGTASSNISVSNITARVATISWTSGNGERRIVFVKEGTTDSSSPIDNATYNVSSTFGNGTQIGSTGWFAVYRGTGASVSVSNLDRTKAYRIHVVELNGIGGEEKYLTSDGTGNPATKNIYAGTTIYANSATGNDTTGDGSSQNPYKTFHKTYTAVADGDTMNLNGTFTWTNADETGDAISDGYTIQKYDFNIQGQSATTTIIQAATASTTGDRRVFTISSLASTTITDLTIRYGRIASGWGAGINNNGTTTLERVHLRDNATTDTSQGYGGGMANNGTATFRDSAILYNSGYTQGGGIVNSYTGTQSTRPTFLTLINSTVAFNNQSRTSGTVGGPGIFVREGTAYILNCTVAENNHTSSGTSFGLGISTGGGTAYVKNSIVANNKQQGTYVRSVNGSYYDISGITDEGGNIVGKTDTTTGYKGDTWYDFSGYGTGDNVYRKVSAANPTGSLNLNGALNTDIGALFLWDNSIAIGNGTTTALYGTPVPSRDQRAFTRGASIDIGSLEYSADLLVDTTPPSISITTPTAGQATSSVMTIVASASDDVAIAGVSFFVDNVLQGSEDTSSPYSITFNTLATTTGSHSTFAVARDTSNNYATSSAISFTVDNTAPTVSVTAPSESAVVGGSTVTLSASASDSTAVAGVKFYINGTLQGSEDTSAPYSITWNSTATTSGSKTIVAVARDTLSNVATSSSVSFTVDNVAPTISVTAPSAGATVSGNVTLSASASDSVAIAGVKFWINNVFVGSEDTSAPYSISWDSTATSSGAKSLVAVARDSAGNSATSSAVSFTLQNNGPEISSLSPLDNATGVATTSNFVITFDRNVTAVVAKNIYIKKSADDSIIETIATNNTGLVSISGAVVTINPTTVLDYVSGYYVTIDAGAFKDVLNDGFTGISSKTTWNITSENPPITYTLIYNALLHGSISGSTTQSVIYAGTGSAVTAIPDSGYLFSSWSDGLLTAERTDASVTENISVNASFVQDSSIVYVNNTTGNDTTGTGAPDAPYKSFHKGYTAVSDGNTLDLTGTFTWTDTIETGDYALSGYNLAKNITIQGHGPDTTIIQGASTDNSADRRVFTISANKSVELKNLAIRYGKVTGYGNSDGGGIRNDGTLTINNCEIYSNRTLGDIGGGISNRNMLNVASSTIYKNSSYYMGGGLSNHYYIASGGGMTVTNSTIVYNNVTATLAYFEGGGVHIRRGNAIFTNNTIAYNKASGIGGLSIDDSQSIVRLKNNIIANNQKSSGTGFVDFGLRTSGVGTIIDNGYNIVGTSQNYNFTGTGDWTDANRDSVFIKYGVGTTGQLKLDYFEALNNNSYKTNTVKLLTGSIAIDNGNSTANHTVNVPTGDQRGMPINGVKDIGAFEFQSEVADLTPPIISNLATSTTNTTATISWTTNENASTQIKYDPNQMLLTSSPIVNSSSMVTNHSITLFNLISCSKYYFSALSRDASGNIATTSTSYFFTSGCIGNATIESLGETTVNPYGTSDDLGDTSGAGGATTTITTTVGSRSMALSIPKSFSENPADFQVKAFSATPVLDVISKPANKNIVGNNVFEAKALSDPENTVSTFDSNVSVTLDYTESDIAGLDESTLKIWRNDGNNWYALDNCEINSSAKTVTCTTSSFSVFGLFGDSTTGGSVTNSTSGNGPIFSGKAENLPGYIKPRLQSRFSDGTVVYHDEEKTNTNENTLNQTKKNTFERNLKSGSNGEDVRNLQKFLNKEGFTIAKSGLGSLGNESDYFGRLTKNALIKFQEAHKKEILLPVKLEKGTGIFGESTRKFLNTYLYK